MIRFDKPLLLRAATNLAANLFVAFVVVAAGAETAFAQDAAMVRPDVQIAAARSGIHVAQEYGRPPGEIGAPRDSPYDGEPEAATQQDSAGLLVRIGRLESQMRQISGQIEQMQFETGRLAEQLKKFQEDVDFRLREGGAQGAPVAKPPQKRGEATETQINGDSWGRTQGTAAAPSHARARGDAFDPSQNPGAPGGPRPLGSAAPAANAEQAGGRLNESGPASLDRDEPGAPLDLSNGGSRVAGPPPTTPAPMASASVPSSVMATSGGTVIAAAPNSAKEEFDIALGFFKQKAYENAEKGFAGFLEKNPKNKLASDAIYYLGESFYQRGRQPEAAEQYLKISTQFANSPRAPDALLRLGQSLNALGAKDQACATYGEIARKYPNAPATVKVGAEREAKRAQC
jgi:tol-pal system protein YbgF